MRTAIKEMVELGISRAVCGAALIDEINPKLIGNINLDTFNQADPETDVLGQCFGDYVTGLKILGLEDDDEEKSLEKAVAHGFIPYEGQEAAWRSLIQKRQT